MKRTLLVTTAVLAAAGWSSSSPTSSRAAPVPAAVAASTPIKHIVIIQQENRSFDSYFGTYPGAEGIPPGVCVPDPLNHTCRAPYHDTSPINHGGPHGNTAAIADINGGKMDGFIKATYAARGCGQGQRHPDVMGYHDGSDLPNYWAYAKNFVLQDHMFEPAVAWSLVAHLYLVSEWSAACTTVGDPNSCANNITLPLQINSYPKSHYDWTDLTYLMHKAGVSWGYYLDKGLAPDCVDPAEVTCKPESQSAADRGWWNPLPEFTTVHQDGEVGNIQPTANFLSAASAGTLPAVSWPFPTSPRASTHPPPSGGESRT